MAIPTAATVMAASNVDFAQLGYDETKLDRLVRVALRTVRRYTGQQWLSDGTFSPTTPLSTDDEVMLEDAVITFTEWLAYRKQADTIETMGDFDLISSFSAGSYSETRRGGKDSLEAQRAFLRNLFWPLMSPDLQDEWIAQETGVNQPSFAVTEVDWANRGTLGPEGPAGAQPAEPYPQFENWDPYYDPRWG